MSAAIVRESLSRRPFEPFRIRLSSGDNFEFRHPENALLVRSGVLLAVPNQQGQLPEVPTWCSFLHIAAVEPTGSATSPGGNSGRSLLRAFAVQTKMAGTRKACCHSAFRVP